MKFSTPALFYIVNSSSGSRSFGVCSRDCKLYLMSVSRFFGYILRLVISLVQLAFDLKRWNLRHRRSAPT